MNHLRILLLCGTLSLAACQPKGPDAAQGEAQAGSEPVAVYNGRPISREFFDFFVEQVAGRKTSELSPEQQQQALDNLLLAYAAADQASKDGIDKETKTAGMIELTRLNVLQQALSEQYLKDRAPTEEELKAEYDTQVKALPGQEYRARHILVESEEQAAGLIARLQKGEKFEDLARKESKDSSSTNGGDLGWFTPERMVAPFSAAVVALKPGEHTQQPVQTQFGWHVIRLEETRPLTPPPYEAVREQLVQMVEAKKFRAYVDGLMKNAKVEKKI